MIKGNLFYDHNEDVWLLKTEEKSLNVDSLIYGLIDLGFSFEGEGELIQLNVTITE